MNSARISETPITGTMYGTCDQCSKQGVRVRNGEQYGEYVCYPCYDDLVFTREIDEPVPFPGTIEEGWANYGTHDFWDNGEETSCDKCAAKVWHKAAMYPCGTEPARQIRRSYFYFGRLVRTEITGPDGVTRSEVHK